MVSFRGQKKLGPCPDRSPLGVQFKISEKHPHPFHLNIFRTVYAITPNLATFPQMCLS